MRLAPERSEAALAALATAHGQEPAALAQAIVDIGVAHIERAVRLVSVQRGHDPAGYALYAYGGMGPLVAALVAEELRIARVVIPPHPGLFSALGLLVADLERSYRRTSFAPLTEETLPEIRAIFAQLRAEAEAEFAGYGHPPEALEIETQMEMRYRGQGFELIVPVALAQLDKSGLGYLRDAFDRVHHERYGSKAPVDAIELVTYRLVARVPGDRSALDQLDGNEGIHDPWPPEPLPVAFQGELVGCQYIERDELPYGEKISGMAIVEEPTATTLIPPGWRGRVERYGALVLEREDA
jgi:N-methylhydantoinase A